ncbi:CPBP family intramembrane glutamic endopeptidase [Flavihumibacter profundi]|uniref:CPBP family intramembrane glutamic endopeptidase n=1 Tax=Flavihumibacter profundi TaxID=2716883 RepID=UPI001CC4A0A1|nr:CPBP family intramembrane glutamic endopeptidase [Flavihumibacter profundi]MBZ5858808.1 CPBP family intramembrane metalloprotease [Flavihumibacter profundi]
MAENYILFIVSLTSFLLFLLNVAAVPGMNLLDIIESRNSQPGIYSLSIRNVFSMLITLVPVMLSLYSDYYFNAYRLPSAAEKNAVFFTVFLSVLALGIGVQSGRNVIKEWGKKNPINLSWFSVNIYLASRILYIISYELYFRGFLFWYCLQFMNLTGAITVNLVFYLVAHYKCNQQIILGCIPMGILLCLSNFFMNSTLPAILIHLCLTIPYEFVLGKKITLHTKSYAI